MRLGLVIYGSLETLSGGYLYDRKLVEHLRDCGDEVEIISMPWIHYAGHLGQSFDPRWLDRLARLKVDVLLQDELNHPSLAWINPRLRQRVAFPLVSIVHHLRSSEQHPAGLLRLYRRVERRYLSSLDGFIFNSQTTRGVVEGLLGRRLPGVVATPGGDRFGLGLAEEQIRARLNQTDPLRILFVGNLMPRKGLDTLLRGLARLDGGWMLRVAGRDDVDPAYSARVKALPAQLNTSRQVEFLGRLDEETLRRELSSAHLLAVPSQYEGFGIVYLEGMAFGLPALASKAGAAGEIIRDGKTGWLAAPGDPEAIAACLRSVLAERDTLLRMSLAARQRFSDFPTWEQSAATIRAYLYSLK